MRRFQAGYTPCDGNVSMWGRSDAQAEVARTGKRIGTECDFTHDDP
jgi:hypothetical protein